MSRASAATETKPTKRAKAKTPHEVKKVRVSVAEARKRFAELLERVTAGRERIVIERAGKIVGFLGTARDLAVVVEEEEDREDAAAAEEALAEMERTGEQPIPYERARRELGLD
jgi:PHD/YefM family antitoxin component YafN of YafNO toxin-antitoxin module